MAQAQNPPTPEGPPRSELPTLGAKTIADLTIKAFNATPLALRLLVYVIGVVGVLAAVFAGIQLAAGQPVFAFWTGMASFLFFLVALVLSYLAVVKFLALQQPRRATAEQLAVRAGKLTWSRSIPMLPLSDDECRDLGADLVNIRNDAFGWLTQRRHDVNLRNDQVRANIFLPDYTKPESGVAFKLLMPDGLRVGMDGHPDEGLVFRPGQGVTGLVFMKQEPLKARTFQTAEGKHEFDEIYHLTPEHKREIHPELRWIVSLPLNILCEDGKRRAAGVLNVDGLTHLFEDEELNQLTGYLLDRVLGVSDKIARLPKVRVAIYVEN